MNTELLTTLIIVLAFPIYFFLLLGLVAFISSFNGGWLRFSKYYNAGSRPQNYTAKFQYAIFGVIAYNRIISLGADEEGIHIALSLPLLFFHPPLFIPWSDITTQGYRRIFFVRYATLRIKKPNNNHLLIPEDFYLRALSQFGTTANQAQIHTR